MQAQGYINAQMQNYDKYIAIRDKVLNGGGEVDKDAWQNDEYDARTDESFADSDAETALILGKSDYCFSVVNQSKNHILRRLVLLYPGTPKKVTVGLVAISAGFFGFKIGLGVGALIKDVAVAFKLATVSACYSMLRCGQIQLLG